MEEDLAREGVVAGMQGREFGHELGQVSVVGQSVKHDPPGRRLRPGVWAASWQAYPDRSHNRAGPAALWRGTPGRGLSWPVGVAPVCDRQDGDDPRPVIYGVQGTVIAAPGGQDVLEGRV